MTKTEKSPKQKFTLKPHTIGVMSYSITKEILNGNLIANAITECARNNDPEVVLEAAFISLTLVIE